MNLIIYVEIRISYCNLATEVPLVFLEITEDICMICC
jgi:hypothetical protein